MKENHMKFHFPLFSFKAAAEASCAIAAAVVGIIIFIPKIIALCC